MDTINLYKLKTNTKCLFLSETIISSILDNFAKSNIKVIKYAKKQVNVMKTNKIQEKKDMNENKLIMIMNKISNNNINELLVEYLNNILVDTNEKYDIIITEIFNKMVKDINFIENYVNFTLKIFTIENNRLNSYPIKFINLLKETLVSNNENERKSCYEIIKYLVKNKFFNEDIIQFILNNLLTTENTASYIDIYYLLNGLKFLDISKYINSINNIIKKCENLNMNREKILIESLLDKSNDTITTQDTVQETKVQETKVQETKVQETKFQETKFQETKNIDIINILEEFVFLKSSEEIVEFINSYCKSINEKNNFCKEFILFYINSITDQLDESSSELLSLMDTLIQNKILFRSNISKGLLLFLDEYNMTESKYIINILKYLKHNNITKNIEHVFKKYKVKLYYDNES